MRNTFSGSNHKWKNSYLCSELFESDGNLYFSEDWLDSDFKSSDKDNDNDDDPFNIENVDM